MLIVGSGYSAADAIMATQPTRPIIHVYRWNPEKRPSPLKGCHRQAYPEYAEIYRQMREAARPSDKSKPVPRNAPDRFAAGETGKQHTKVFPMLELKMSV